jgi:Ran GTPase-activating protein (RanGAP) involved in mRNA processing and transport
VQCKRLSHQRKLAPLHSKLPPLLFNSDDDELIGDDDFDVMSLPTVSEATEHLAAPSSPRSSYIFECLKDRMNPRVSYVVRKDATPALNFRHLGIGNKMAQHLSKALKQMPCVQSVDISDNALTDIGMKHLLQSIVAIDSLTELNISENKVGIECSKVLEAYFADPSCKLKKMTIRNTEIDDNTGLRIVTALAKNRTLRELDLGTNHLGVSELLNTVHPGVITAPEAIASLLLSDDCALESLNLEWNKIRLQSAQEIAKSIQFNRSLISLDLSNNSIGTAALMLLGASIHDNQTLQRLSLAFCGVTAAACFVLCTGLQYNYSIKYLNIDGNPIGVRGAKALMLMPTTRNRITLSARGCNMHVSDPDHWFDQSNPCGNFELNLSNYFDRAVAQQALRLAANHPRIVIKESSYQAPGSAVVPLKFVQVFPC